MSHLARQEIYFDKQFGLDETLQGIEQVTSDDVQRVADRSVPAGVAVGDGARKRQRIGHLARTTVVIPRYTHPDMGRIWSDERRYRTWLQVEVAAAEAMAAAGLVPDEAARDIRDRADFDVARIEEIERTTQHDVIAFTDGGCREGRAVGALASLRDDFVGCDRHRAGAADARRVRRHPRRSGRPGRRRPGARVRASADADDRAHPRRPRRADDVRLEAGVMVLRDRTRHRARPPGARRR